MSKTARAAGTVGHVTIGIPLHIVLTIVTCGLWIPVWVYMSVQRRNRRQAEALEEARTKAFKEYAREQKGKPYNWNQPPDPFQPSW